MREMDLKEIKTDEDKLLKGELPEVNWWNNDPEELAYTRTFTSFGGADIVATMDGDIIGEMQDITWEEDFFAEDEYTITGATTFVIFDRDIPIIELAKSKKHFNITLTYMDEYGNSLFYRIYDCLLTKRSGKHSVDDIIISEKYSYKAKKIEKLTKEEFQEQVIMQD
jgi:hypothetical protein